MSLLSMAPRLMLLARRLPDPLFVCATSAPPCALPHVVGGIMCPGVGFGRRWHCHWLAWRSIGAFARRTLLPQAAYRPRPSMASLMGTFPYRPCRRASRGHLGTRLVCPSMGSSRLSAGGRAPGSPKAFSSISGTPGSMRLTGRRTKTRSSPGFSSARALRASVGSFTPTPHPSSRRSSTCSSSSSGVRFGSSWASTMNGPKPQDIRVPRLMITKTSQFDNQFPLAGISKSAPGRWNARRRVAVFRGI